MIYLLINEYKNYSWGSTSFIQNLLNINDDNPIAELWIGIHKNAPSNLKNTNISLEKFIEKNQDTLGTESKKKFTNLPFLLKILSAEKALSIQVHPNKKNALLGFQKENKEKIPLSAFNRSYKDVNHKPELVLAITKFTAMCGFRELIEIKNSLSLLEFNEKIFQEFSKNQDNYNLKNLFINLLKISSDEKKYLTKKLLLNIKNYPLKNKNEKLKINWIKKLANQYKNDIGIFAPLFLNVLELNPNEAISIKAGILHSYLSGNAIEIMANSDNVIRGGLTDKYIDIDELRKNGKFLPSSPKIIKGKINNQNLHLYKTNFTEFELLYKKLDNEKLVYQNKEISILLILQGSSKIIDKDNSLNITKGNTVLIPANNKISIVGNCTLYIATIPI